MVPLLLAAGLALTSGSPVVQTGTSIDDSLRAMIGQMILVGFRGMRADTTDAIYDDITARNIGGVILFEYDVPTKTHYRNVESPEQLARLTARLQEWAGGNLLISIDQEGGRVNRLKPRYGFPPTPSAGYIGSIDNPDTTTAYANGTARLLADHGINLNFAPVVDVNVNPDNPIIGAIERSYSADADAVARHASLVVDAYRKVGVLTALKHFPGHGSSRSDTHLGLVDVTDTWTETELVPYRKLIASGHADAIMTAHVVHRGLDPEGLSSTLSPTVIDGLLRDSLGFDGVVFSDDLQMGAIRNHYDLDDVVERAINAGVDIMIFGNNSVYEPDIAQRVIAIVEGLVSSGRVTKARIQTSYRRITALKSRLSARSKSDQ